MEFFSPDGLFYRIISRIGDLFILNILFLICSLPILTIGASATAMYSVLFKLRRGELGYISKEFLEAFQKNFKQATIIWSVLLGVGGVLGVDIFYANFIGGDLGNVLKVCFIFLAILYMSILSYVFAIQSRFENSIRGTIKASLYMSIGYLPITIVIMFLNILPGFLSYLRAEWFWKIAPIMLVIGIAGIGYICAGMLEYIFRKHIPKETKKIDKE